MKKSSLLFLFTIILIKISQGLHGTCYQDSRFLPCLHNVTSREAPNYGDTIISIHATICSNQQYKLPSGSFVNVPGTYYDVFTTSSGYDSTVITELVVKKSSINATNVTISCGQNYTLPSGLTVSSPGTYNETLTSSNGCDSIISTVLTHDVSSLDMKTLIPNAFSPNEDGLNDELCIPSNLCIEAINLIIYDRLGEKVFETNSKNGCWNGTYKGRKLEPAVFVYYFTIEYNNGITAESRGNISLVN